MITVIISIIGVSFVIFCHVKVYRLNCAIDDLHKKEIADLKFKLLLSGTMQSSELGESKVGVSSKTEQLSSLKKEQQVLDKRIIWLEVECELEQIMPLEPEKLLV